MCRNQCPRYAGQSERQRERGRRSRHLLTIVPTPKEHAQAGETRTSLGTSDNIAARCQAPPGYLTEKSTRNAGRRSNRFR
jgi:hypothetical protein